MWKIIAEKSGIVLAEGARGFYAFGHRENLCCLFGFPVEQCGSAEEVCETLSCWYNGVDKDNPHMREIEQYFLSVLKNLMLSKLTPKQRAFVAALEKAKQAALAYQNTEDGGTCNFDAPAISPRALGMTAPKVEQAVKAAGLRCFSWKLYGSTHLVISGLGYGQGNRRTEMAEAACKSLQEQGYECGMYYQMD